MRGDRAVAIEAALLIVAVRASFVLASFVTTRRWLTRSMPPRRCQVRDSAPLAPHVGRAVRAAARRLPGTTCLVEAVTAELMLRRRGIESTLHIGVRAPCATTPLDAHAWLECNGAIIVGDRADVGEYQMLASRP